MNDVILHHYDLSPFSEKMRKILAYKEIAYHGVEQPSIAPKPHLTPLTGGYRRIPVLQIGAHIYCDTALMVGKLDALFPEKPLTPAPLLGVAEIIADWADHRFFQMTAAPTIVEALPNLPPEFMADREALSPNFNPEMLTRAAPHMAGQLAHMWRYIDTQTSHTPYILGDAPTLADMSCYHIVNFVRIAPVLAKHLTEFANLIAWLARIDALGAGQKTPMTGEAALKIAKDARPDTSPPPDALADDALPAGAEATITADDYGPETTHGKIAWTRANEIAILRVDDTVGEIMVHYPRAGYRISVAG